MYLNLDLLYNISYFLTIRFYKYKVFPLVCAYNNNYVLSHNTVDFYKGFISHWVGLDLHGDLLNAEYTEIEPFKIDKNLYYALIKYNI